jgi:hypothetical protein
MSAQADVGFNNPKNKATLWGILYEQGVFNKFNTNDRENIKTIFDNTLSSHANLPTTGTLLELNKQILPILMQQINAYSNQNQNQNIVPAPERVSASDITEKRLRAFEHGIYLKEQDFKSAMKLKKPEEINFADKTDEDSPVEMEQSLQTMIDRRQKEFNQIIEKKDTTAAKKWIAKDVTTTTEKNKTIKKVHFLDTNESPNEPILTEVDVNRDNDKPHDFFEKLKKTTPHEEIMNKLNEILEELRSPLGGVKGEHSSL